MFSSFLRRPLLEPEEELLDAALLPLLLELSFLCFLFLDFFVPINRSRSMCVFFTLNSGALLPEEVARYLPLHSPQAPLLVPFRMGAGPPPSPAKTAPGAPALACPPG